MIDIRCIESSKSWALKSNLYPRYDALLFFSSLSFCGVNQIFVPPCFYMHGRIEQGLVTFQLKTILETVYFSLIFFSFRKSYHFCKFFFFFFDNRILLCIFFCDVFKFQNFFKTKFSLQVFFNFKIDFTIFFLWFFEFRFCLNFVLASKFLSAFFLIQNFFLPFFVRFRIFSPPFFW